ncbi:Hda3p ASCRUDRAFT_70810 [Ascoidea rubescens DSM 1968]|uniref:Uncharacterized protein n=1 Tax=Ascoidea rubescens DSM 1968 TaxID=1344418 RepID=A0A1D2VF23_9ASCO|nr:hypothetical protein ASCRUDRAFT_70810 [Ascoidea rubescens DSM 1968]ODV60274.1 hypothetical protein ASCRUDRAFT_70810 [Ascoidea rubescens DSM 1968]
MDLTKILDTTPEPPIINPIYNLVSQNDVNHNFHDPNSLNSANNAINSYTMNNLPDGVFHHENEYWLPTPMADFQKELTDQIVSLHYSDILKYFETDDNDQLLIDSLQELYLNSQLVSNHPYLLIKNYMPKSLTSKDIPKKLSETSGKFRILRNLIEIFNGIADQKRNYYYNWKTRKNNLNSFNYFNKNSENISSYSTTQSKKSNRSHDFERNLIIVARSGETVDLIEALLLGLKVNIKRFTGNYLKDPSKLKNSIFKKIPNNNNNNTNIYNEMNNINGNNLNHYNNSNFNENSSRSFNNNLNFVPKNLCNVYLFASSEDQNQNISKTQLITFFKDKKIDLIISFDITFDINLPFVKTLRSLNINNNYTQSSVSIIRLVPINTIEHIALYFRNQYTIRNTDYLMAVTSAVVVLRGKVGILSPDLKPIYSHNLTYLSDWLLNHSNPNSKNNYLYWPLPKMSSIPKFNSLDVEKSLLTEVHYTLDDDYSDLDDLLIDENLRKHEKFYFNKNYYFFYNFKRLNKNYLSNPLKQDLSLLTGINSVNNFKNFSTNLTHKLLQSLNLNYSYYNNFILNYFDLEVSNFKNARQDDLNLAKSEYSKFINDFNHLSLRKKLNINNHKKKLNLSKEKKEKIKKLDEEFSHILNEFDKKEENSMDKENSNSLKKWKENQLKILTLTELNASKISKIKSIKTENDYLKVQLSSAETSIKETDSEITLTQMENDTLLENLNVFLDEFNEGNRKEDQLEVDKNVENRNLEIKKIESQITDVLLCIDELNKHQRNRSSRRAQR